MIYKCICCESKDVENFKIINNYILNKCNTCKIIYLWPQPATKDLDEKNEEFYGDSNKQKSNTSTAIFYIRRSIKYALEIKSVVRTGNYLDIGSGLGYNLLGASHVGFKSEGVEISKGAYKYAQEVLGQKVYNKSIDEINLSNYSYDVVSMYDVLERMRNPKPTLQKIRNILKKDGILVIQCPNISSIMARITGKQWTWLLLPFHLFRFTPQSIKRLLEKNNFTIIKLKTRDEYSELVKNILWILKIKSQGRLKLLYAPTYYLLWIFYPLALIWSALGLGGLINVYAQKT